MWQAYNVARVQLHAWNIRGSCNPTSGKNISTPTDAGLLVLFLLHIHDVRDMRVQSSWDNQMHLGSILLCSNMQGSALQVARTSWNVSPPLQQPEWISAIHIHISADYSTRVNRVKPAQESHGPWRP